MFLSGRGCKRDREMAELCLGKSMEMGNRKALLVTSVLHSEKAQAFQKDRFLERIAAGREK